MTKTRHEVAVKNVQEKEKGKTLQDTETTTHTAKYRKNYNSVTLADLDEMERNDDHTLAFRSVVKDKIWVKIDFQVMKDAGKNSGYVFFVNKMRTSIQNTPPDNADSRKAYTTGLIYLKEKFEELSTIEEMQDVLLNFTDGKVEGVFTGDSWKVQNTVQKIYGKKFFNFAYQYTTSYSNTVRTAKSYNSISKDEEKQIIQAYVAYLESELKKYQEKYQEFLNIRGAKANHGIYESRIENLEASIQNPENDLNESKYKARPADWSWAFPKKRTKASSGNRTRLNKPELSHIVREGGLEITDVSNENMKDNYGFSLVNYGSSLSSKRREAHAKHFLGAMSDLAQVLDIDLAKANQLGDLQIHFGTSGKKGSMAFYARNLKKININNRNGDGSIAHEWAHYLDNMLAEGSTKRNSPYMATERQAEYPEIQKIIKELKFLFIDGNKVQTYEIEFFAKNAGTYYFNKPLKAKTIEEAIKELRERSPACEWFSYHKRKDIQRSFGIIARTFKVDKITVPYEVHESQFYANSKVLDKKPRGYWTSDVELFARAFEVYILNKLAEHGMKNNYLVSLHGEDRETAPYPYGDEAKVINAKFDELFAKIKEIYEIGNFQSDDKKVASKPSKSKELENVSDSTPLDKPKEEEKPKITRFVAYHGSKVDFDQFSDNSFPYFTDSKSYALSFAKPFGYLYHVEADTLKAFDFTPLGSNMIYRKNIIDLLNQTFEAKGEEILTKDERDEIMLFNLPQNRLQFFNIVRWLGQTQKDGILYRILEKRGYDSWIQRDGVQNTKSKDSPWALVVFEPQNEFV